MTLPSRSIALTFAALTFAACTNPFPPPAVPLDLLPQQYEAIAWSVGMEFESSAMQLTAQDALGTMICCSRFSRARPGFLRSAASKLQSATGHPASFQVVDPECGVASQDPPTDSDADQAPDNLTITFALPACRFVYPSGGTYDGTFDLTGVIRLTDPQPGTASMAFNMALDDYRMTFTQSQAIGYLRRDGLASVFASASGLSQTMSWVDLLKSVGLPDRTWDFELSATFAPAEGATITSGEPLPDGTYAPSGSFEYRDGNRFAHFTVTTVEPLQYSAECAAQTVATGYGTPFTGGLVRVSATNGATTAYVNLNYFYCSGPGVTYVPGD